VAWNIAKQILEILKEKSCILSETATLRILYLALLQEEAKFVLDYLHFSPLANKTFTLNFKAIAFSQLNRIDDAFDQIDAIISLQSAIQTKLNGMVFKDTVSTFLFECRFFA
jgi:hypothetical protein